MRSILVILILFVCSLASADNEATTVLASPTPIEALTGTIPQGQASASNAAQGSDNSAQMSSMMMAAAEAAQCKPPTMIAPCIMAALAAIQGAAAGGAGNGAGQSAGAASTIGTGGVNTSNPSQTAVAANAGPPTSLVGTPGSVPTMSQIKATLAAAGADMSDDNSNLSLPGGMNVPLNSGTSSDDGLSKAGLSADQIAQARADVAATAAGLGLKGSAPPDAGGAAGFGGSYQPSKEAAVKKKPGDRAKPSLSGLTKSLGGDKIGVSADDIFEMVSRRYQAKDKAGTFLK